MWLSSYIRHFTPLTQFIKKFHLDLYEINVSACEDCSLARVKRKKKKSSNRDVMDHKRYLSLLIWLGMSKAATTIAQWLAWKLSGSKTWLIPVSSQQSAGHFYTFSKIADLQCPTELWDVSFVKGFLGSKSLHAVKSDHHTPITDMTTGSLELLVQIKQWQYQ